MPYGQDADIGISFQNSFGTPLQDSIYWIPMLSEDVGVMKPPLISQSMRGIFEEGDHYQGPNTNEGSISTEINPITIGALFQAAMGAPATSGTGPYTHIFKPATDDWDEVSAYPPITLTYNMADAGSSSLFSDMNIAAMELNIANTEFLTANFTFVGGSFSQIADVAASYPVDKEFTWDGTSMSVAGTAIEDILQLNVKLDSAIVPKHTLNNSLTPSRLKRSGFRTLSVAGTLLFSNQDEYQEFLSQSERNLTVTFVNSAADKIELIVPLMRYTEFKPKSDGPGEVEISFSGKGVWSATSATVFQVTLTNDQAAY